jgi:phosphate transport system protein
MAGAHTDKAYEAELNALREKLLSMGERIELAIARSVQAVVGGDAQLAREVIEGDRDINRLEIEIDDACLKMLALRQPAASDLRFITTALKIVTDLERMGDLAVNIADRAQDVLQATSTPAFADLTELARLSQNQFKNALKAFVETDSRRAQEVMKQDDVSHELYAKILNELLAFMAERVETVPGTTSLLSIARNLERFGDHATNLAEMVIYMVDGKDVRHARSRGLPR